MAYDAKAGIWVSRDPSGESGGENLYEAFNDDPIDWNDPEGTSATRSFLGGSDTTDFHATKEVAVLPGGGRQVTYHLFLSRTEIFSPGVGAPGQTIRSQQEIAVAQRTFAGENATNTEAVADKTVATRVESLNQINGANAFTDNMAFGFSFVPFFTAVDHYKRGEPWKLDAALSSLALLPAAGSATKALLVGVKESSTAVRVTAEVLEAGAATDVLDAANAVKSGCFPAGTPVAVVEDPTPAVADDPLIAAEKERAARSHQYWMIGGTLSAIAVVGWYTLQRKHRATFKRGDETSDDPPDPHFMPLLPGLGGWDSFLPCLAGCRW